MLSNNDLLIKSLVDVGRLIVDAGTGFVYSPKSNTPKKPLGAETKKGYLRTCVTRGGQQATLMLHRIVWISQNGLPEDSSFQVDHLDGNKKNNHPLNLELVTHAENMDRSRRLGLHAGAGRRNTPRDDKGRFLATGRLLDGREWNEMPGEGA